VFPDEGGRLALTPIDADAADSKLGKIEDKTMVAGGRTQLNLHDGQNLLVEDDEYSAGDSIVVSNDDSEVVAHFRYEEGSLVTAVRGAHAGEVGEIEEIQVTPGSGSNSVTVATDDGTFETVEEYVVVIDENFTGEAGTASEDASGDNREGGDDE
jgi:small subunit ribosomal protein S4e